MKIFRKMRAYSTQMVFYGQNQEDEKVLEYFGDFIGTFLDIGSFTGIELSNVRNLVLKGWGGVMIEPSPKVFPILQNNYKDLPNIHCLNIALGEVNGESSFYDNQNGVATLVGAETRRWRGREKFNKVRVPVVTFNQLYHKYPLKFHFISIDCEGLDYQILKQIDFDLVGCMMIIIEWDSKTNLKTEIVNYINKFDLKLVAQNPESLIFKKEKSRFCTKDQMIFAKGVELEEYDQMGKLFRPCYFNFYIPCK